MRDTMERIGDYDVLILGDWALVTGGTFGQAVHRFTVPNYGIRIGDLAARPGFRIRMATGDDTAVLSLFDADDDDFGYTLNLACPDCSEWGYCR